MKQARDADAALGNLPASWPRGQKAERQFWGEALANLEAMHRTLTSFMERFQGVALNNTLEVCTATFDSGAFITRSYHAAAGSVEVANLSTHPVTVSSGGPAGAAPAGGRGVAIVQAGVKSTIALASTSFTLYGTAGDQVTFQVFTTGANGSGALLAVDGGSA